MPTPTPWEFNDFTQPNGEPMRTVQDVADTINYSTFHSESAELWGVSMPGNRSPVICYTGNGPTSKENAAHIVRCVNSFDGYREVLNAWSKAHWMAGIPAVKDSNDPMEELLYRTRVALGHVTE